MILIVGLGNKGGKYDNTYHNIGFNAVDKLAKIYMVKFKEHICDADIATLEVNGTPVLLAKPTTFMNASGIAVQKLLSRYKLSLNDLIVISDDIELKEGTFRYREKGSAGTHNGLRSIIRELGSGEFRRYRIGCGRDEKMDLADYVLSKIDPHKAELIDEAIDNVVDKICSTLEEN